MPTVEVNADVDAKKAQQALSDRLGTGYKVTATSDSSLKVTRNVLLRATVEVRRNGDATSFHITSVGMPVFMLINSTVTIPKIRQALEQAFSQQTQSPKRLLCESYWRPKGGKVALRPVVT
jgi:hypothetical protein